MVRHQSDVEGHDIRLYDDHPMAVGSDVRVGRVGWVTDILWIAVCYQGVGPYGGFSDFLTRLVSG